MPAPSPLAIATSSVQRLVKEEVSYHKELKSQEVRLEKLLASKEENENREFEIRQERTAIAETNAVFPSLRQRTADALAKLEDQLEGSQSSAPEDEISKAKDVIAQAKAATAGQ